MMTKSLASLFVLMFIFSCGKSDKKFEISEKAQLIGTEEFKVKIKLINFHQDEKPKIIRASELIQQIIISEEFKEEILNHKFKGKNGFADNRGLSNQEIYNKILAASEKLTPGEDREMDLTLVAYLNEEAITIGYTYPNTHRIWMNRKYFARQDSVEVTANMVHEWLHKLGFDHASSPTSERPYSVPYAVGYLVRRLARQIDY